MEGYGEFFWSDGKKYKGFYKNDKKEGFGIFYWANPPRIYIGYWKNGKQDGIGKYLSSKHNKFGKWEDGERKKWYNNSEEAFEGNYKKLNEYFKFGLEECINYIIS